MKKYIRILAMLLTALFIIPVFPSYSADLLNIVDDSNSYQLYRDYCASVYDVADSSPARDFSYEIPEGGAVILIFFNGAGWCHNSNSVISGLSSTLWAKDERFNVIAVDSYSNSRSTVAHYLETYDLEDCVDHAYCNPAGAYLQAWYVEFIKRGGNMQGVDGFTSTLEFAHALIITKVNGKPTIRYSIPSIGSITLLTSLLGTLFEIPDGKNETVTVEIPGVRRYDCVEQILAMTNSVRAGRGKPALGLSARLTELAMERAEECAVYYNHERPNGYTCFSIGNGTDRYPGGVLLSENIAIGRNTPGLAIDAWTNSEGHLANMISTDVTEVGIGCFVNNGHYYWVQLFADGTDSSTYHPKGATEVTATVETLESRLAVRPSGRKVYLDLGAQGGEELCAYANNMLEYQNDITYLSRYFPLDAYVYDRSGEPIAKYERDGRIIPLKEGSGTLVLKLYDSDRYFETLHVLVRDRARDVGDIDGDGAVTMKDVLFLRKIIAGSAKLTPEFERFADVDGNGKVNLKDLLLLRRIIAGAV